MGQYFASSNLRLVSRRGCIELTRSTTRVSSPAKIDMELDDSVVHLKAGMCWCSAARSIIGSNRSKEPCVIAFVLIDAKPFEAAGRFCTRKVSSLAFRHTTCDMFPLNLRYRRPKKDFSLRSNDTI
jgi:hypothetical protein